MEREEHFTQLFVAFCVVDLSAQTECCRHASLNMWAFHFHLQYDIRGILAHFHWYIKAWIQQNGVGLDSIVVV